MGQCSVSYLHALYGTVFAAIYLQIQLTLLEKYLVRDSAAKIMIMLRVWAWTNIIGHAHRHSYFNNMINNEANNSLGWNYIDSICDIIYLSH